VEDFNPLDMPSSSNPFTLFGGFREILSLHLGCRQGEPFLESMESYARDFPLQGMSTVGGNPFQSFGNPMGGIFPPFGQGPHGLYQNPG
jgi:hypothetical protein